MEESIGKFNKILRHPDKEEIIERLTDGQSLKQVEGWLKKKYAKRKRLQISWVTLQKFRKEHLLLHGEVLEDIKNARAAKKIDENSDMVREMLSKSTHYQDKINEIADTELDASRRLLEMDKLVSSRLEYYFNVLQSDQGSIKEDKVFLEYMKEYRAILESWKKFIDGHADKKIEHNININVVNEQISVLKGVIFEVLREMDPSMVPMFVDKLNQRMGIVDTTTDDYKRLSVIESEDIERGDY